jgi:GNAT superfamily N-acetyltransferase
MAQLRDAHVGDAFGIATVHVRSWLTTYPGIMPEAYLKSLSIEKRAVGWERGLQNPIDGAFTLVAEEDGQIVGFAAGGPERDGDPEYPGELYAVYLLQEYQGKGIGRQLFAEVTRRLKAQGFRNMLLWVAKENHPSRAFYERMGGVVLKEKAVEIMGQTVWEVAYGYDLEGLA